MASKYLQKDDALGCDYQLKEDFSFAAIPLAVLGR